jgi:glycosyltransferase involved in cell wall biosynthesis
MSPKITVLTTVYNGMSYLKEAIDSTLSQTFTDFEFLIIDDASTDESLEFLLTYIDPRIRVVKNVVNMGQTASLNKGLSLAKGEFIARLDQDDVNLPNRLEEQLAMFIRQPELTLICSWEHTIDSNGKLVRDWKKSISDYGVFLGEILLGLCPVWHPSVMFRKTDVLQLGAFDISYGPAEDYELWGKIAMARFNAAIVPQFHLLQRVHNEQQSNLQADKQLNATIRAHRKVISSFYEKADIDCLCALLRLNEDPCGKNYSKKHLVELGEGIKSIINNISEKTELSKKERNSLLRTISKRVGMGVFYTHKYAFLPSSLFYVSFYLLSPFMIPSFRTFLSKLNRRIKGLRYFYNS